MVRWALVVMLAAALVGCGSSPNRNTKPQAKSTKPAKPATPKPVPKPPAQPQVPANLYPDIAAALAAMRKACDDREQAEKDKNREGSQKAIDTIRKATAWLARQGPAAVSPLLDETKKVDVSDEYRLAATRALGDIGPPALGALQEAVFSEAYLVRMKAVESLGEMRPVQKTSIELLIRLLSDPDGRVRQLAITALEQIGPPAKDAGPKLNEILNSDAGETERDRAAKALKAVNPRKTFQD